MSASSSDFSLFGVVSSVSPVNTELAPARKHIACVARSIAIRPALRRTTVRGMTSRATAMARTCRGGVERRQLELKGVARGD